METAMKGWWLNGEVDLDELLKDEIMAPVMKSAGTSRAELRRQLAAAARRLAGRRQVRESGYRAAFWELRAVR
jgi:hypothetical protein